MSKDQIKIIVLDILNNELLVLKNKQFLASVQSLQKPTMEIIKRSEFFKFKIKNKNLEISKVELMSIDEVDKYGTKLVNQ